MYNFRHRTVCQMHIGDRQPGRQPRQTDSASVLDKRRFWHLHSSFCWRYCRVKQKGVAEGFSRQQPQGEVYYITWFFCLTLSDLQPEENYIKNVSALCLHEHALRQMCYISLSHFLPCCWITLLSTDICVMWKSTINGRSKHFDSQLSVAVSDQHYGQIEHIVLPQSGMVWDTTEIT